MTFLLDHFIFHKLLSLIDLFEHSDVGSLGISQVSLARLILLLLSSLLQYFELLLLEKLGKVVLLRLFDSDVEAHPGELSVSLNPLYALEARLIGKLFLH